MNRTYSIALERFVPAEHIRNLLRGDWVTMYDEKGEPLPGIRGRMGVSATSTTGTRIGIDLMEMQPGAAFPLHVHEGDHLLYFASGHGQVRIGSANYDIGPGDSIFIPADAPHSVTAPAQSQEPLVLLAIGHPHVLLDAYDRMERASDPEFDR